MTVVDHTRDHDLTIAGAQAACGWALHMLATEKHRTTGEPLPIVTWNVDAIDPRLSGWADTPADVLAWAGHLGVAPRERRGGAHPVIDVHAITHGVQVRVWARLRPAIKEV